MAGTSIAASLLLPLQVYCTDFEEMNDKNDKNDKKGLKNSKEILGGLDGTARCSCGRLRYPKYKLCPTCYYAQKENSENPQLRKTDDAKGVKNLSVSELIKLQVVRTPLPDREDRIAFLERKYGKALHGREIRFMTNRQLYAISEACGYRK